MHMKYGNVFRDSLCRADKIGVIIDYENLMALKHLLPHIFKVSVLAEQSLFQEERFSGNVVFMRFGMNFCRGCIKITAVKPHLRGIMPHNWASWICLEDIEGREPQACSGVRGENASSIGLGNERLPCLF